MVGREEIVRSIIKFEIPHSDLKGACWRIIELGAQGGASSTPPNLLLLLLLF